MICSIKAGGRILEEPALIRNAAVNYFKLSYSEEKEVRSEINGHFKRRWILEQSQMLEEHFKEEEIVAAIKDCHSLKAPRPDGFNFSFIKKAWTIMREDMLNFFADFYDHATLARGINCTFITLIPKVDGASCFKEFRPISMVGCIYKILAKVLANRLRKGLPTINSGSFCGGGNRFWMGFLLLTRSLIAGRKGKTKDLF